TGSTPCKPDIPGVESAMTAVDALKGVAVGDRVVICGGGLVGCEVAWYLAGLNKEVTIVEMLDEIGMDMEMASRMIILKKLHEHDVDIVCDLKVEKIIPGEGIVGIDTMWTRRQIKADTVVLAMGFEPNRTLFDIQDESYEVYVIGDAKEPRRIIDAMREADHIARFEV
ncbi:MAG: FAD-dependent oxidoreductase, partial [Desulfobacterales bacterium]|nr:FAD-dependent oxidoreductase [Desulfobacterales bacterium]